MGDIEYFHWIIGNFTPSQSIRCLCNPESHNNIVPREKYTVAKLWIMIKINWYSESVIFKMGRSMFHTDICTKKHFSVFNFFLLFIGISGMIFAATFDLFKAGVSNFGINQLAGFVVSAIVALAGLRKIELVRARMWDGLLLAVYLAGILFMGLRSTGHFLYRSSGMLQNLSFSFSDVAMNFLGFIPLGYLMMSYLLSSNRIHKKRFPAICLTISACIGISLIIEVTQYYLPGRTSSLLDLLFNGLGAIGGICYGLFEKKTLS